MRRGVVGWGKARLHKEKAALLLAVSPDEVS
jgi:hypothetical protein